MSFQIKTEKRLSPENVKRIIAMGLSLKDKLEEVEKELITDYDSTKTYSPDMACYYNDYLYRCLFTTTGEFDINSWEKVGDSLELVNKAQVEAMLGLTPDELDTLANLILDSEVRLDKTWSSSKIYESVQEAIRENKKFTLEEFAKANKASYTVVDSVDTMTDQSTIYLLKNDITYDMYIVQVDGTPTKIGDVNIDLSQYVKISELNSHTEDKSVHFESQTEKDSMLTRDDIVTEINNIVTNEQIPSAKAIYDNYGLKTYTSLDQIGLNTNCTIKDIYIGLPTPSMAVIRTVDAEITDIPTTRGVLIIHKPVAGFIDITFKETSVTAVAPNNMWVGSLRGSDGEELTWSRVCTTRVPDIEPTSIIWETDVFTTNGSALYYVKNGICQVNLEIITLSLTVNKDGLLCAKNLPKAKKNQFINISSWGLVTPILFNITENGNLQGWIGRENNGKNLYCSFSYPVADNWRP